MNINNIEQEGQYKFENCIHRSPEMRTTIVRRCACQGGDYQDTGYDCSARGIFKVEPGVCAYCHVFEEKKAQNNN